MEGYFHRRRMELFHRLPKVIAGLLAKIRRHGVNPNSPKAVSLLDIGCWDGEFTVEYAKSFGSELGNTFGVDFFPALLKTASERGIQTRVIDLENEAFPFPDGTFNVVICNQVLEHLKQIYLPLSEIHRVLREGGYAVISVPNLAALHNRILLLAGRQPATIRIMGPHVRGFALGAFTRFLLHNNLFALEEIVPVGMYPFPIDAGSVLARLAPSLCHTPVWILKKTSSQAPNWIQSMQGQKEQTTYFGDDRSKEAISFYQPFCLFSNSVNSVNPVQRF